MKLKNEYLLTDAEIIIPDEHNINKWTTFLPPLKEFTIRPRALQDITKEFKESLMRSLKTESLEEAQREKLLIMESKIILFSLGIQEKIQQIVQKKILLMTNMAGVPFLENYCCDENNKSEKAITIQYFTNEDREIGAYNHIVKNLANILEDIEQFWTRREIYRQYNFIHKRGILLYGAPGCGKSGIIQLCVKHIIEKMNGIVINIKDEDEIRYFSEFISTIRKIEPTRPLIVILEDIDSLAGEDSYSTTKLLNILDGIKQIENVVYIATTNYPEKLQERITNRPARFDRRYQVEMPSIEIRRAYLNSKLSEEDLKGIDIDLWLKSTEDMSLSHLKELVISVIVMGKDFKDAIAHLTGLKDSPRVKRNKKMGF
jgi:ATP-dependent 26S proteasome regulatory subunit